MARIRFRTVWVSSVPWLEGLEGIDRDHNQAVVEVETHTTFDAARKHLANIDDFYGAPKIYEEHHLYNAYASRELGLSLHEWEDTHVWEVYDDGTVFEQIIDLYND